MNWGVHGEHLDDPADVQWIVVDLNPGTPVATALHIRAACSHIQNVAPMALPAKRTEVGMLFGVRYDTTNASPANLAELQTCLQRFPAVQGVEPEDAGDAGG